MNERLAVETELSEVQNRLAKVETQREAANEIKMKRQSRDECAERLSVIQRSCLEICSKNKGSQILSSLTTRCGEQPNNRWAVFLSREVTRLRDNYEQ